MATGESARRKADQLRAAEERARKKAEYLAKLADNHDKGADGEVALVGYLAALGNDGYYRFDDLGIPGRDSNIDLVLIGPGGVFVVDAKNWSGTVKVDGLVLRQNGSRRAEPLEQIRLQAATVAEALDQCLEGRDVPVWPVIGFVGEAQLGAVTPIDRVFLVDGPDLVEFVRRFPATLVESEIQQVGTTLYYALAARTAVAEHAGDDGSSAAPEEPVVFLTPWSKFGKRRIYVRDELGIDGGYLDLVSGELVDSTPSSKAVLGQLLSQYAATETPEPMSSEDSGVISRFLKRLQGEPSPAQHLAIVVGYRWIGHGRSRLYVHRLRPDGTKIDLGWMDLKTGRVHADVEGQEPVVRYCGERYLALQSAATD